MHTSRFFCKDWLIVAKSQQRGVVITFLDSLGVVLKVVCVEQTVNFASYVKGLKCLRDAIQYKNPYKWRNHRTLDYDSVPCDIFTVQHYLVKNQIPALLQPLCSPDLAPRDFKHDSKLAQRSFVLCP
jgi:hypothetical protein